MFSGFQKLIDRGFIIGFLFPSAIALIVLAKLFPHISELAPLAAPLADDSKINKLTYVAFIFYGLAIVLSLCNTYFFQLVEGYTWPLSSIKRLQNRQAGRRDKLNEKIRELTDKWKALPDGALPPEGYVDAKKKRLREFPPDDWKVLPTTFGNAIAAFESYPKTVYQVDAVPIWLRLISVISKDFASEIEGARAQVNFFLNLFILLPLIAIVASIKGLRATDWTSVVSNMMSFHLQSLRPSADAYVALGAAILTPLAYRCAVSSAHAWGEVVIAAFDVFLPKLIGQLGYLTPTSEADRRAFWDRINQMVVFQKPIPSGHWRFSGTSGAGLPQAAVNQEKVADQ